MHRDRLNRREILKSTAAAIGTAALTRISVAEEASSKPALPTLCLFTKPLQKRPLDDLPALVDNLDFEAVDLTCRPGGHVLPERVEDDLPKACELFKSAGIRVPMITTGIVDAGKDNAEAIVKTAAALGIRYVKLGYYLYGDLLNMRARLAEVKASLRDIAALCRRYHVQAGLHNHSGPTVGSALWDVWYLIDDLPADGIGSYFDGGHATVEGGDAGWRIGLNLLAPRIVMLSVKDFAWEKDPQRGWRPGWCPLGEGMVRWEEALRRLKSQPFSGPISLHVEYPQQAEPGSPDEEKTLAAIRHDAKVLRELLKRTQLA